MGKTALAVHWAHRVASQFPDGQIYVNLRGFNPGGTALKPSAAVRTMLEALQVPQKRIPSDLDGQVALYREVLDGRRILVLLDNARDAEHVHLLLPGTPSCLVIVTSRQQLSDLPLANGPITLDLMSTMESQQLLADRLDRDRVAAEPGAVDEIIIRCARLPLALAVVAARTKVRPHLSLTAIAAELREGESGLDAFATGDVASDMRSVLSWSYGCLSAGAALLFRLVGLHPGPDMSVAALASLAGLPLSEVEPLLGELADAYLLTEYLPGRYACHDLLRAYAGELSQAEPQRDSARQRLFDHYLHTAYGADHLIHPNRDRVDAEPTPPTELADAEQALDWFTAERAVLLTVVEHAAATGFDNYAWQLSWAMNSFLDRRARWHDQEAIQTIALAAARRMGDRQKEAHAHRLLGRAYIWMGRDDEADSWLRQAIDLFTALEDPVSQAQTYMNLAAVAEHQGDNQAALSHAQQASDLYRNAEHRYGQAVALGALGWYYAIFEDYGRSIIQCEQAIDLLRELGDRVGEGTTLDSLGFAYHCLGNYQEAIGHYQHGIKVLQDNGNRYEQTFVLIHLGDTYHAIGDFVAAREVWKAAAAILDELGHAEAAEVHAKIEQLD